MYRAINQLVMAKIGRMARLQPQDNYAFSQGEAGC